jgi:O-antigen/teichoic acid export membrane protein
LDTGTKKLVLSASTYTILNFGFSQVIRFAGNLILTRLLVPDYFGLIATSQIFITGLFLLSDIGLEQSIIRSSRADDPDFLNSAWTIQVIRTAILTVLSFAIALPAAAFYKEPLLAPLIGVIGAARLIVGFESTSLFLLSRKMDQKKMMIIELTVQVVSLLCIIAVAFFFRTVWALIVGDIVGPVIRTIWSHRINKEHPNKFKLEKAALAELVSFGKWILVSTAIMFLSSQVDRVMLGKFFGMAWFGVYGIAFNLSEMPKTVISKLGDKIVFPLISKFSYMSREELRGKIMKPRAIFLALVALMLAVLACFGDYLIDFLFDERYLAAAWIFPILVIGSWPHILVITMDGALLAIGKPLYAAIANLGRFIYLIVALPLAYRIGGAFGAVVAIGLNGLFPFIGYNYGLVRERLSLLKQDAAMTLLFAAIVACLVLVRMAAGLGIPGMAFFLRGS